MHKENSNQGKNDEHEKTYTDYPFECGSINHSKSNHEVIDGSGSMDSKGKIDVITRGERSLESDESNYSETHTNATGRITDPTRRLSPSSSLESSSNDAFKLETVKFESKAYRTASKDEQDDISSHGSSKSEVDNSSPIPTSTNVPSTVISPPIQAMDPSRGYDPKRIPSSVFATKTSPMEWSTASNESLFSIHLGNNSFSQEHAYMFNELYKSGELNKSGEFCMFSPHPFVIPEEKEIGKVSVDMEDSQTNKLPEEPFKSGERSSEDQNKVENPHPVRNFSLSNISGHSRWSANSTHSFAFPM